MQRRLTIYLDENHCENKRVLAALEREEVDVKRHLHFFAPGTPDTDWLPFVGEKRWAVVTTDKAIRKRALERLAVKQNNVMLFCFTSNQMSGEQMALAVVTALPKIRKIADRQPAPFIATISPSGVVQVYDPFDAPIVDLR